MLDCLSALDFSSLDAHAFCKNFGFAYAAENSVSLCSTDGCAPSHEGGSEVEGFDVLVDIIGI